MGADLYQVGKTYPDGYFRDSYNDYNVLWQMGLSWWQDITPMLKNHKLSIPKIKRFKAMVESRQIPDTPLDYKGKPLTIANRDYFIKERQALINFLNQALTEKREIECSL